ncbi:hypothetical protein, partial [Burkholderia sp. SIMBA_048]|uniref:hypothetical protein n=1 Tax=Burkholderia sp. SIMBA_048 TaxID=3085789 RepID=UPI00397C7B1E
METLEEIVIGTMNFRLPYPKVIITPSDGKISVPTDFGFMACIIAHSFKDAGYLDSETIFSIILSKLSILLHPQHYI